MSGTASTFHDQIQHHPFGGDRFGKRAEQFARFFGTPGFLVGQTIVVVMWIAINVAAATLRWDPYPFILLNLAFSLQAAYAAPMILLAQTRQADRDKSLSDADAQHREALAQASMQRQQIAIDLTAKLQALLDENTRLTRDVEQLTREVHRQIVPSR